MPLLVGVGGQKSQNNGLVTGTHKAPDMQARAASLVSVSSVVAAAAAAVVHTQ